jgi:hypothetical protein
MSEEYDFVEKSSPWTRPGVIAAAGFLALILVVGIVLTTIGVFDDDKPNSAAPPAPSASSTPTNPAASLCGLPGHDTSGALGTAPKGTTWELVSNFAAPATATAGPAKTDESGVRYCYAHTKEGAVIAAANIFTWGAVKDEQAIADHVIASGPGRTAAVAKGDDPNAGTDTNEERFQIAGFRLLSYDDDSAMVDVALRGANGSAWHMPVELVWEQADWRVRLLPDGSLQQGQALPDLTGYVPWSGA